MLFFNAQKILLLVYSKYLDVYFTANNKPLRFNFNEDTVSRQEILNQAKFDSLIQDLIIKNNLKGKDFLVVMTDDVIYTKSISQTTQNINAMLSGFLQELPFNPAQVSGLIYKDTKDFVLIGTNSQLYMSIKNNISKTSGKLIAVVPSIIFAQIQKNIILSPEAVKDILAQDKLIDANNFLKTYS